MKRTKMLALTLGLCILSSMAVAENPANWSFNRQEVSHGGTLNWTSPTAVDNTFNRYDYTYAITEVRIDLGGFLGWFDVTDQLDPATLTGSGGEDGTLPLIISNTPISQQGSELGMTYDLQANMSMSVDASGYGHLDVTDVTLLINGNPSAMQVSGTMDVTGSQVPEPCTMALLGAAGVAVLARRRKRS